ncbi:hypothetical protein N657DRAFT_653304 [Parathielavia appendiculata]|uniref:PX-associated-domain-containing protein n=1 Tax=Parathielavia appendiculata TaxID=2587402 RepID=A0AAN6U6T4_9PEZI|nr:hypothetical protein N657DRAFT_653304 [Parathielavia appendiculata]
MHYMPSSNPDFRIPILTASQLHALFDILTHHETYAEVERFKEPATISEYGYPFGRNTPERNGVPSYAPESSAPLLAGVFRSIVLQFPGLRDLPPEFWYVRFQGIMEKLAEAELSESCDKGAVGTRKTLATAASAIHEVVSRGILGGVEDDANRNLQRAYNRSKAEDLVRAWEDSVHELVYGNLVEELFACAAEKQSLEEHSPGVQAAADYIIIHLATLVHHVFVLSPEGPYLLKLLENVHKLLPYSMIKQTLRIGNAATMLQGIMRLLLAKVGVGAISNWVGLTQNADDGMNLLQRIISLVLSWDALEFRKSADAIEKAKGASSPSKDQLSAIRDHLRKPRHDHEDIRKESIQIPRSIIVTILERSDPALLHSLSEAQHAQCSEYFAALLEARDRDEISNVLCRQNPDLFTQAIKNVVASFEPMIRAVHERVDLREHVSAAESFITDLISLTKAKKSASGLLGSRSPSKGDTSELPAPSVEDYVLLLQNNRHLLYNWLHQVASQCPEIRDDFCAWAKETIKVFRQPNKPPPRPEPDQPTTSVDNAQRSGAAGSLSTPLQQLFTGLPPSTKQHILPAIDAHATYLSRLETLSLSRMQRILDNMEAITSATSAATATPTASTSYLSASYWSGRSYPRSTTLSPPLSPDGKPRPKSYSGPGMYLFRWQQLLDSTIIGPASLQAGSLRTGRDVKGVLTRGKIGSGGVGGKEGWDSGFLRRIIEEEEKEAGVETAVDVSCVVEALGEGFRKLVGGLVKSSPPECIAE